VEFLELLELEVPLFTTVGQALLAVVAFVLANFIMGVAKAVKLGHFALNETLRFMQTNLAPVGAGILVLAMLGWVFAWFAPIFTAIAVGVCGVYGAMIIGQFKDILSQPKIDRVE